MRLLSLWLLLLALGAADWDPFDDGGIPRERPWAGSVDGGLSYRWWRMETEAGDGGGSLGDTEYRYRDGAFAEAGLRLIPRPWRFELDAALGLHQEQPSVLVTGAVAFVGDDAWWWELAPRLQVRIERRRAEVEHGGGTSVETVDRRRLALGFIGQGPQLAGSSVEVFLEQRSFPTVLGFRGADPAVRFATFDRDFELWRWGLGMRYDWAEYVLAGRRRHLGPYAALWGEIARAWYDPGTSAADAARAVTGREAIVTPDRWDLAGGIEVGLQWHRRSAERAELGFQLRAGWRLDVEILADDGEDGRNPGADTLITRWERAGLEHGPFARLGMVF